MSRLVHHVLRRAHRGCGVPQLLRQRRRLQHSAAMRRREPRGKWRRPNGRGGGPGAAWYAALRVRRRQRGHARRRPAGGGPPTVLGDGPGKDVSAKSAPPTPLTLSRAALPASAGAAAVGPSGSCASGCGARGTWSGSPGWPASTLPCGPGPSSVRGTRAAHNRWGRAWKVDDEK
eukprot:364111-Chlamydomonas_euryale.AAC.20